MEIKIHSQNMSATHHYNYPYLKFKPHNTTIKETLGTFTVCVC